MLYVEVRGKRDAFNDLFFSKSCSSLIVPQKIDQSSHVFSLFSTSYLHFFVCLITFSMFPQSHLSYQSVSQRNAHFYEADPLKYNLMDAYHHG